MKEHLLSFVRGRHGHFRLESGHHGDLWFQLETLCQRSRDIRPFAAQLAAQLVQYEVEVVCGPLVEGAFVALLVSLELGCDFAYAERFADTTREGLYPVEYRLPKALQSAVKGKRVAIVNDVISAGSAVRGLSPICKPLAQASSESVRFLRWAMPSPSSRPKTASPSNSWSECRPTYGRPPNVPSAPRACRSKSSVHRKD